VIIKVMKITLNTWNIFAVYIARLKHDYPAIARIPRRWYQAMWEFPHRPSFVVPRPAALPLVHLILAKNGM